MRTETIEIFSFDELTEEAQGKALKQWQENGEQEYTWSYDSIESLKAGIAYFGCEIKDYQIDFANSAYSSIKIDTPYYEPEQDDIEKLIEDSGKYNPETFKGLGECKLTGVCFDEDFLDGVRMSFKNGETDIKELMIDGYNQWHESVTNDYESQFTIEHFKEHAITNEYEFTEDGEIYG